MSQDPADRVLIDKSLGWLFLLVGAPFMAIAGYYTAFPPANTGLPLLVPVYVPSALLTMIGSRVVLLGPIKRSHLRPGRRR
jgi:hypothetical protein